MKLIQPSKLAHHIRSYPLQSCLLSFLSGSLVGSYCFKGLYMIITAGVDYLLSTHSPHQKYAPSLIKFDVPENAPHDCPGLKSSDAGKAEACAGCPNRDICASGDAKVEDPRTEDISSNLANVKNKILVLSGKGGVGKSTIATQLSWLFQEKGLMVGLLDIDICGPSIPLMTGSRGADVHCSAEGWSPIYIENNFAVMSVGYLIPDENQAVIWRGPKKNGLIRQFLSDVDWGNLDILVIDTPPGTSDEHLSIVTYLSKIGIDGALIVTTPQEASLVDVRREIMFCKNVGVNILGLVENMKGSDFDVTTDLPVGMKSPAQITCETMEIPYLGIIPAEKSLAKASELGSSISKLAEPNSLIRSSFDTFVQVVLSSLKLTVE